MFEECWCNSNAQLLYSAQEDVRPDQSGAERCQMSLIPNTAGLDKLSVLDNPEDFIHDYNTKNVGLK